MNKANFSVAVGGPDQGDELKALGITNFIRSAQVDGKYYAFSSIFPPGEGNRMHRHLNDDELVHLIRGNLNVHMQGSMIEMAAGDVAALPKGEAHSILNASEDVEAEILVFAVPGVDLEAYFDELNPALEADPKLPRATLIEIGARHNLEWLD